MRAALVGDGPAATAVRAALADTDAEAVTAAPDAAGEAGFAVVTGTVGDDRFDRAHRAVGETPWLAVELGGVGGRWIDGLEAAVSGFAPTTACFDCLRTRVAANRTTGSSGGNGSGTAEAGARNDVPVPGAPTARFAGAVAGREAARLLGGEESPALGGVVEVPHATRRLLPVPGCGCGEDRVAGGSLAHESVDRPLEEALVRAERALDARVGVVHEVGEAESFPVPYYLATVADTTGFSDAAAAEHAAGVDPDWNAAFMKALGEALERYAAGVYRTGALPRGRPADVPDAVHPGSFVLSGAPATDAERAWVAGEHLGTGEAVHLPAELVLFPPPTTGLRPSITTGLGLGNSPVEALRSGLYEVLERDAAMLAWYSTFEPLGLGVDDEQYRTLARRARSEGLATTALLCTQDVDVPVVAACVHRPLDGAGDADEGWTHGREWPHFAAGMDADLDAGSAATNALAEALQNWTELRGMGRAEAAEEPGAIGRYADFPAPVRAFVDAETTVPAASVGPDPLPAGPDELVALLDRLGDADLDAYAARLTTRDLDALGFEAVRVLVPAAQPLFTDDPYFGDRARRVPRDLGFEPRLDREHHPFP